jgi:hypothetical protein
VQGLPAMSEVKVGARVESGTPPKQGIVRFVGKTQVSLTWLGSVSVLLRSESRFLVAVRHG